MGLLNMGIENLSTHSSIRVVNVCIYHGECVYFVCVCVYAYRRNSIREQSLAVSIEFSLWLTDSRLFPLQLTTSPFSVCGCGYTNMVVVEMKGKQDGGIENRDS